MSSLRLSLLLILFAVVGCASSGKSQRAELRKLVSSRQYVKALSYIHGDEFFNKKENELLKLMEVGTILHLNGNWQESAKVFEQAKDVSRKQFTVSISKKAQTFISNDKSDIYYGENYEVSLIHYYWALNNYLLYQSGEVAAYTSPDGKTTTPAKKLSDSERRTYLLAARAAVVQWDSFLEWIRLNRLGKTVFKDDLLAKTFGAFIHEVVGSPADLQTALLLYRSAKDLLFKNYNAYKTLNAKALDFKKDFSKLPGMGKDKVAQTYIVKTAQQENLEEFLNFKILQLTRLLRPNEYKKMVEIHKPSNEVLARLKTEKKPNVAILLQRDLIPRKVAKLEYYSLESALTGDNPSPEARKAAQLGSKLIMIFAASTLGLVPPPRYSPVGAEIGIRVAAVAANHAAISFELPAIEDKPNNETARVVIQDKAGNVVKELDLPVIDPMVDIAREAVAEGSAARYTRLGVRLATKHLAAISASFVTYKATKKQLGQYLAKNAALVQYMAASKGIQASEGADTRYWSTLPADYRFNHLYLPKGDYKAYISVGNADGKAGKKYQLGDFTVTSTEKQQLINFEAI